MGKQSNIVVFLPNWVGDVVMATPALRSLREHFADAHIAYVARPQAAAVIEGTADADEVFVDKASRGAAKTGGFWRMMDRLRGGRFDLAVLMPNSFRTALLAKLAAVRRIVGYKRDGRGFLLSDKLAPPRDDEGYIPTPAIDYYNALAAHLGAAATSRRMSLPVTAAHEQAADALLAESHIAPDRPLVMLNAGAAFGTSKLWSPRGFAAVADALIERRGARIIINAAPSERAIAAQVQDAMSHRPAISFTHRANSIGLLKSLLRRCDLLVTNDTGARHVAAAVGCGIVTVFGSTDPDWTVIYYDRERLVETAAPCAPCQKKTCTQSPGPMYHQCMATIEPPQVLAAAEAILDEPSDRLNHQGRKERQELRSSAISQGSPSDSSPDAGPHAEGSRQ